MKDNYLLAVVIVATITLLCLIFTVYSDDTNSRNIDFLKFYGWEVSRKPIEKAEIIIPEVFDDVYLNYNKLQEEAALDLTPYRGYSAIRYTYKLKNFPFKTDSEVFANVISVDSVPVAGDICTYALDGFMYSLNFNVQNCYSSEQMKIFFTESN